MAKKCRHYATENIESLRLDGGTRVSPDGGTLTTGCWYCGALGVDSLGPSNDEPEAVRLEMRAAELWSQSVSHWASPPLGFTRDEDFGWYEHEAASHSAHFEKRLAGWLARELATHYDCDARDASAWPWDPARPVAPQFDEWVAQQGAASVCGDGLEHEGTRMALEYGPDADDDEHYDPVDARFDTTDEILPDEAAK